jgi:serine/threonine-protein kinase
MELKENLIVADKFRLVRMIGRGGMGSVWQAQHVALDTPCAVKFIEGELANVSEAHARFEREAKAAAQLRSQHVVQIFDHGVWQGKPYIAMELLNGEDLGRRLAKIPDGRLPLTKVHEVVQQAGTSAWRVELGCDGPLPARVVVSVEARRSPPAELTCRAAQPTSARTFEVTDLRVEPSA